MGLPRLNHPAIQNCTDSLSRTLNVTQLYRTESLESSPIYIKFVSGAGKKIAARGIGVTDLWKRLESILNNLVPAAFRGTPTQALDQPFPPRALFWDCVVSVPGRENSSKYPDATPRLSGVDYAPDWRISRFSPPPPNPEHLKLPFVQKLEINHSLSDVS